MNSDSKQPENDAAVIEELTAYLDGELDPEEMQVVEQRMGEDPDYLSQMQSLQKTWDMLDALPQTEPGTSFTKTTMALVVGQAVNDVNQKRTRSWVWPTRIAVMIAVPALLFATSFGVIRNLKTGPDRFLVENLGVIDNHYRYSIVENDLEFLTKLNRRELFSGTPTYVDVTSGIIEDLIDSNQVEVFPESREERTAYIESLDVEQKRKLKKKLDDFVKLPVLEQDELRDFDRDLNANENRDQLFETMNAYYDWLKTIDSGDRSRLLDLSVDERITAISDRRRQQALEEFGSDGFAKLPSKEDAKFIFGWCDGSFEAKEKQIREHFPIAFARYASENNMRTPPLGFVRRKAMHSNLHSLVSFLMRSDRVFIENLILDDGEMSMLYEMLSPAAKTLLGERTTDERKELVLTWVESVNQSKCDVSIDRLRAFEKTLSVRERDDLDELSHEGYIETLRRKFRERQKSSSSNRFEPELDWESLFDDNLLMNE